MLEILIKRSYFVKKWSKILPSKIKWKSFENEFVLLNNNRKLNIIRGGEKNDKNCRDQREKKNCEDQILKKKSSNNDAQNRINRFSKKTC